MYSPKKGRQRMVMVTENWVNIEWLTATIRLQICLPTNYFDLFNYLLIVKYYE